MTKFRKIGVLTSGGDAPGMNAAIRAVTRTALYHEISVVGIKNGYQGMIMGQFMELESYMVGDIIQRGGTILKSARSEEFKTEEGRKKAYENLKQENIDGVVVIGGDGSFRGARVFTEEFNIPFVGIPGTIDNDLYGADYTIGYDTALNTIVESVDKIRDTASSHDRLFFIEVMGRDAGFLALRGGIATGAEAILIPEINYDTTNLKEHLAKYYKRKKLTNIVLVAEGDETGGAFEVAEQVREDFKGFDIRVTVLGHIQRGGPPSAFDRVIASQMGAAAVDALMDDQKSVMVGLMNRQIVHVPFNKTIKHQKDVNRNLLDLQEILSI
ncbi:MAG: 6-phosphofructokinase [Bacteroidales bacterium]|nr:6-phosphofructokinase [Bacteroidales bacterium]MBS3773588.1 6-phosphofructokinase [Bacteroidales bacterium]